MRRGGHWTGIRKYAILPCLVCAEGKCQPFMNHTHKDVYVGEVPVKWFILLHLSLILNSLAGTASKLAGRQKFLSFKFMFWYGVMLFITFAFALAWQQILKHMSLTFAFTNKPVTIIWGLIWGVTIFHETLTWKMLLGSAIILVGIIIGVSDNQDDGNGEAKGSLQDSLKELSALEEESAGQEVRS